MGKRESEIYQLFNKMLVRKKLQVPESWLLGRWLLGREKYALVASKQREATDLGAPALGCFHIRGWSTPQC